MQYKKVLKQKSTNDHKWILHFDALPTTPIGWFWLFSKVGTYMFSYYYNTSILQMWYVSIVQLDMTKNQLPFLSIIEIKQNPTNLFNYFIYKSYKNTSIIRL
jgi:hypothetical protein